VLVAAVLAGAVVGGAPAGEADALTHPPPRSVADVIGSLERSRPETGTAARARAQAAAEPPARASAETLRDFYRRRAEAAGRIGSSDQQIADLALALEHSEAGSEEQVRMLLQLSIAESIAGNPLDGLRHAEQALRAVPAPLQGLKLACLQSLIVQHVALGDLSAAQARLAQAERVFGPLKSRRSWQQKGTNWTAYLERSRAEVLAAEGRLPESERAYRKALAAIEQATARPGDDGGAAQSEQASALRFREAVERGLGGVLLRQGKLVEAEVYARAAIRQSLERAGPADPDAALGLTLLAKVVSEYGRDSEAIALLTAALEGLRAAGVVEESLKLVNARKALGSALVAAGRYAAADALFAENRKALARKPALLAKLGSGDLDWVIALLRIGRQADAEQMATRMLESARKRWGPDARSTRVATIEAFHAMTLVARGSYDRALDEFRAAVPILIEQARSEAESETGTLKRQRRLVLVLESYLQALAARAAGLSAAETIEEAFRVADVARGSAVQRALTASVARANLANPALAALARREQDIARRLGALSELLAGLLESEAEQRLPAAQEALRREVERLRAQRASLRKEIMRRFPDYAELVEPSPATAAQARAQLQPGEVLASWYFAEDRGYVWALGPQGAVGFSTLPAGRERVGAAVEAIRRSLDPGALTLVDEIPPFDVAAAHRLYRLAVQPVADRLRGARLLLVVPHGALGQLPLALLPTADAGPPATGSLLFAGYREVPWLMRQVATAQFPSVTAFVSLRRLGTARAPGNAFIGFGDPLFGDDRERPGTSEASAAQVAGSRGARLRVAESPKAGAARTAELGLLPRLPDTAAEVLEVARTLGADPAKDVYLEQRAVESAVLKADLSRRRVIMFATHGLVPGDIDGLDQPALALTSPAMAKGAGDGLLTLDEILGLKLDADWVVLSACNTASGNGAGAEAVSGLGRGFFFAGARALLVSNWPVETTAARRLMAALFGIQAAYPELTKAEALRQAVASLVDREAFEDPVTREPLYSYAHPLFWAPFVLVGD
jgi:CHAT domain-containing protein